jgi:class 3 adenylate cyclase
VASRLNQFGLASGLVILVSGEIAQPLSCISTFPCKLIPHGDVPLRGRALPVSVFEVKS